jgi:hypothetical protein
VVVAMRIDHLLERAVQPGADGHHLPEVERCAVHLGDLAGWYQIGCDGV